MGGACQSKVAQSHLGVKRLRYSYFVGMPMMCCRFSATERHCATFQKPKGVLISPPSCGKQPAKPGLICQLSCRPGYVLSGVREVRCATSGKWSAKVQTAVCKGRCLRGAGEKSGSYIMAYGCRVGLPLCGFYRKSMVKWQVKATYELRRLLVPKSEFMKIQLGENDGRNRKMKMMLGPESAESSLRERETAICEEPLMPGKQMGRCWLKGMGHKHFEACISLHYCLPHSKSNPG